MFSKMRNVILLGAALQATAALAQPNYYPQPGYGQPQPRVIYNGGQPQQFVPQAPAFRWKDLVDACNYTPAPGQDNQITPSKITVSCAKVYTEWRLAGESTTALPVVIDLRSGFSTSKNQKSPVGVNRVCPNVPATCPVFKEVAFSVALSPEITCKEAVGYADVETFCIALIAKELKANAKLFTEKETGNFRSSCQNAVSGAPAGVPAAPAAPGGERAPLPSGKVPVDGTLPPPVSR